MRKICAITGIHAEYALLRWDMQDILMPLMRMKQAQLPLFQREELVAGFWMLHGTRNNPSTVGADRVRDLIRGPIMDAEGLCLHHTVRAYRVEAVPRRPLSARRRTAFTEPGKWQNSIPRHDLEAAYRTDMPNTMINQNHSAAENKQ